MRVQLFPDRSATAGLLAGRVSRELMTRGFRVEFPSARFVGQVGSLSRCSQTHVAAYAARVECCRLSLLTSEHWVMPQAFPMDWGVRMASSVHQM
jgi:hypothetical protein